MDLCWAFVIDKQLESGLFKGFASVSLNIIRSDGPDSLPADSLPLSA
jgi:hypothetical protein